MNNTLLWYTEVGVPAMYTLSIENVVKNGTLANGIVRATNMRDVTDMETAEFTYDSTTNTFELFGAPNVHCGDNTIFTNYKNIDTVSRGIIDAVRW